MSLITRKQLAEIDERRGGEDFKALIPAYEAALDLIGELDPETIVILDEDEAAVELAELEKFVDTRAHLEHLEAADRLAALKADEAEEDQ